jgi:DNA-binding response OmpR family regulator
VKQRILIVEDHLALASLIAKAFESDGYLAEMAHDGHTALKMLDNNSFDLIILDLDLPVIRGPEVLARLRAFNKETRVLMLTAMGEIKARVACLDGGADDYVTKPVSLAELAARVRALLRRGLRSDESVLRIADLELDRMQRSVSRAGRPIVLTGKEFSLLEYFMRNSGRDISRNMILEDVWHLSSDTVTNVVDVYVNYLRKKIDEGSSIKLINTVRGVGFRFGASEGPGSGKSAQPATIPADATPASRAVYPCVRD